MIGPKALRSIFDGRLEEARQNNRSFIEGRLAALCEFHDILGLETDPRTGVPQVPLDDFGLPQLRPNRAQASEFSLRNPAEAIMGHDFVEEYYHPAGGFDFGMARHLQEAAIDPSAFINI